MPGLVYGAMSIVKDCPNLGNWMIANGVLALVHMIAALYIVKKIRETSSSHDTQHKSGDSEAPSTNYSNFTVPNRDQHGAANSFTRIKHVLCYDKTVAVYIIIFIGWIVWLCIGMARRFSADGEDCDQEVKWMNVIISCGYIYLSMVFVAFGCSLCCLR